jgi:hypothetical protein
VAWLLFAASRLVDALVGIQEVFSPAADGFFSRIDLIALLGIVCVAALVEIQKRAIPKMERISKVLEFAIVENGGGPAALESQISQKV